jgi:integrase/recombinase XerD
MTETTPTRKSIPGLPLRIRFVQAWVDGEGRAHHYFRKRGHARVRLPGLPGSSEFMAAYQAALTAAPAAIGASRSKPGSIAAAIAEYFGSAIFRSLTGATPTKRRRVLEAFREQYGERSLASLPQEFIVALTDSMTPHNKSAWLKAFRHFIGWAKERKLIKQDPTFDIKVKVPKSDGHHTWTEAEIGQYEAYYPIGSKPRLAEALGLYTALRREDAVLIGRQHFRNSVLTVRPKKTETTTRVTLAIPVHPELQAIIDATPTEHLTLLVTRTGKSYGPDNFSKQFRKWCDEAGLPQRCVFHGLRKAALTRLAQAGCTPHEIMSISGHNSLEMVEHYTRKVEQARLAQDAMAKRAKREQTEAEGVKGQSAPVSKPLSGLAKNVG